MRIEKVNENSIMVVMNNQDLIERNLNIVDLSYGSEKARKLIVEMIQLADMQIGFKLDSPFAVEAVPLKEGEIKLFITKIDEPDEMDVRFSKFTPYARDEKVPLSIMKMLEQTIDKFEEALHSQNVTSSNTVDVQKDDSLISIFEFNDIDDAADACKNIKLYDYMSVLYKNEKEKKFYLVLNMPQTEDKELLAEFIKICNTLAEYGQRVPGKFTLNKSYYDEHYKIIIKENAVEKLGKL